MTMTNVPPKIDFSSLLMPYTSKLNAYDLEAWDKSVDWVRRFSLLSDRHMAIFPTLDYHILSAYAFPAANAEQLSIVNDCMTAFYLFDKVWDGYAENNREKKRSLPEVCIEMKAMQFVLRAAMSRTTYGSSLAPLEPLVPDWVKAIPNWKEVPNWKDMAGCSALYLCKKLKPRDQHYQFMTGLEDLRDRVTQKATPAWKSRFRQSIRNYFQACFKETVKKFGNPGVPSKREYMIERQQTGGVLPSFELAGLLGLTEMPAELLDSPIIRELSMRANNVITLFNDLISLEKEMRVGDTYNMVLIIQHEEQCTLQAAADRTVLMHNHEVSKFEMLRGELEMRLKHAEAGPGEIQEWAHLAEYKADKGKLFREVGKYVQTLCDWMYANKVWSELSERYRSPVAPAAPPAAVAPAA